MVRVISQDEPRDDDPDEVTQSWDLTREEAPELGALNVDVYAFVARVQDRALGRLHESHEFWIATARNVTGQRASRMTGVSRAIQKRSLFTAGAVTQIIGFWAEGGSRTSRFIANVSEANREFLDDLLTVFQEARKDPDPSENPDQRI